MNENFTTYSYRNFNYCIIKSHRRTVSLSVNKEGLITVKTPMRFSESAVQKIIDKNFNWIIANIQKQKAEFNEFADILDKSKIMIRGKIYNNEKNKNLSAKIIYKNFFNYITERTQKLAELYGFNYTKAMISNAKTLWGSCKHNNEIRLNWRLIILPDELSDYVILHELTHTIYHNHSKQFWDKLKSYIPDCKERRKLLAKYAVLMSF